MFRASPWITYDPPASDSQTPSQQPDNESEMDAPQISTLHDDGESPPSNASPARTSKFRVKLLVNEPRMGTKFITFNGETGEEAGIGEEAEEDDPEEDEEEDQLIDDQDDTSTHAASTSGAVPAKAGTKRPAAKAKSSQAKRKARPSAPGAPIPPLQAAAAAATTTVPSEPQTSLPSDVQDPPTLDHPPLVPQAASAPPAPASKKKSVPKGTTAAQRAPRKSAPTKPPKAVAAAIPLLSDAAADFSEGHTGTVPSSPAHVDARTPEPEAPAPTDAPSISVAPAPEQSTVTLEDLDGIPHPRYPLPTKPFQVQPPPKISTGYAPVVPLDRTKTKPRHWRPAHREVRGIAGGRWFARAWVGEKDSELAIAAEAALSVPKLPALSVSAPAPGARGSGKRKPKVDAVSTAASSRSASAVPEVAAPSAPPQRSAIKRSGLSTTVATSEVDMDIDVS